MDNSSNSKWLYGYGETTIDAKTGRLLIPQKMREKLGKTFVLTIGPLGCLQAFSQEHWDAMVGMIMNSRPTNAARGTLGREVMGNAEDISFDSSGRAVVPAHLRNLVKMTGNVILKGVGNCVELWPAEEYTLYSRNRAAYKAEWTDLYTESLNALDQSTGGAQ